MFGHAEPIVDCSVAAVGKQSGRGPQLACLDPCQQRGCFRTVTLVADEFCIMLEFIPIASLANKCLVE